MVVAGHGHRAFLTPWRLNNLSLPWFWKIFGVVMMINYFNWSFQDHHSYLELKTNRDKNINVPFCINFDFCNIIEHFQNALAHLFSTILFESAVQNCNSFYFVSKAPKFKNLFFFSFFWGGTSQIFIFKQFLIHFFTEWMVYFLYIIKYFFPEIYSVSRFFPRFFRFFRDFPGFFRIFRIFSGFFIKSSDLFTEWMVYS